jgi:endonuclease YncB( thermonuclease family)
MATCRGSASCRACRDCSKCAHCRGGGTCGVCSSSTGKAEADPAPSPKPKADRCTGVIDVSAINVLKADGSNLVVRLLGVAAPVSPSNATEQHARAELTARYLRDEVVGWRVRIEQESPPVKDGNGAALVYVYRSDGVLINEQLIAAGFAEASDARPFKREEEFREAQDAAQRKRSGIWGLLKKADDARKKAEGAARQQAIANEKIAERWLGLGASIEARNPAGAISWYERVVEKYADVPAAEEAREKIARLRKGSTKAK